MRVLIVDDDTRVRALGLDPGPGPAGADG